MFTARVNGLAMHGLTLRQLPATVFAGDSHWRGLTDGLAPNSTAFVDYLSRAAADWLGSEVAGK